MLAFEDTVGTLTFHVGVDHFNDSQLLELRRLCNALAGMRNIVYHCEVSLESAQIRTRVVQFATSEPLELWRTAWSMLFHHPIVGRTLQSSCWVWWLGNNDYHDFIWVYRNYDPADYQCDGFDFRFKCIFCERHYFLFCREDGRCPYCYDTQTEPQSTSFSG